MAAIGFYNANRNRGFPFLAGTTGRPVDGPLSLGNLPWTAVVDCGFLIGPRVLFDPVAHSVHLERLERVGTTLRFVFGSDCPALHGVPLRFTRDLADDRYSGGFADSGPDTKSASLSSSLHSGSLTEEEFDCEEPRWGGFLVTGDIEEVGLFLAINGVVTRLPGEAVVEPALVQTLRSAGVTGISLANDDRSRVEAPAGCDPVAWPAAVGGVFVAARCLTGDIHVVSGYNATVRQAPSGTFELGAAIGAGAGQPCAEVVLFEGETPPDGSPVLSGGPGCGGVLRTVNGAPGPILALTAGAGAIVTALPESNTIKIDVNMSGLALCFESVTASSESLSGSVSLSLSESVPG